MKILARQIGVESITVRKSKYELRFLEGYGVDVHKYAAAAPEVPGRSPTATVGGQLLVEKLKADHQALTLLAEVVAEMAHE